MASFEFSTLVLIPVVVCGDAVVECRTIGDAVDEGSIVVILFATVVLVVASSGPGVELTFRIVGSSVVVVVVEVDVLNVVLAG